MKSAYCFVAVDIYESWSSLKFIFTRLRSWEHPCFKNKKLIVLYFELVFHIKCEVNVEIFVGFLLVCLPVSKSVEHNCVGLFLDFPFCFMELSVYSSTRLYFLISVAKLKSPKIRKANSPNFILLFQNCSSYFRY